MKKTLAIAAIAAALCVPAMTKAQAPLEDSIASLNDNSLQIAALLQDDPVLFGEPAAAPAPAGEEFADRQDGKGQRPGPGMREGRFGGPQAQGGCPMMGGKEGQSDGGPKDFRHQGAGRMESMLAAEDPAKFAELQKLREQEGKIVKELSEKAKASREEFKKLVEDYKASPSDDLKAKEAKLAEFSQKIAEAKKDKDSAVDAILEKVISKDKESPKGDRPGHFGFGFKGGDRPGPGPSCPMNKGGDKPAPPPAPAKEG